MRLREAELLVAEYQALDYDRNEDYADYDTALKVLEEGYDDDLPYPMFSVWEGY